MLAWSLVYGWEWTLNRNISVAVVHSATGPESFSPFLKSFILFRNREGRFLFSKILLILWEEVCKSICVFTVYQIECAIFYCRLSEEAFCVSLRHSTLLECLEFDIHWHSLLFKLKILQLLCSQMQYNNFCVLCIMC